MFGCLCYPNLFVTFLHKLSPRSTPCLFLGYPSSYQGYRCLDVKTNKVIIARHIAFDETVFPYASHHVPQPEDYSFEDSSTRAAIGPITQVSPNAHSITVTSQNQHVEPTLLLPITLPSVPISKSPLIPLSRLTHQYPPESPSQVYTVESPSTLPDTLPPSSNPIHSMRTRAKNGIFKPNFKYALVSSHLNSIARIPKSYLTALKDHNWYNAMLDEYNALISTHTLDSVPRPPNANVIQSMWVFFHNDKSDGTLSTIKHGWLQMVKGKKLV